MISPHDLYLDLLGTHLVPKAALIDASHGTLTQCESKTSRNKQHSCKAMDP